MNQTASSVILGSTVFNETRYFNTRYML